MGGERCIFCGGISSQDESEEVLGSVTTHSHDSDGIQLRTSACVSKKNQAIFWMFWHDMCGNKICRSCQQICQNYGISIKSCVRRLNLPMNAS